jgi:glucose-6-phosphate-specific signal transduction histidine kinase
MTRLAAEPEIETAARDDRSCRELRASLKPSRRTNVLRHAQADSASVTLWLEDDQLRMKITDNGMVRAQWTAGVGLSSIRERATALGGRMSAGPTASGGEVLVALPLVAS